MKIRINLISSPGFILSGDILLMLLKAFRVHLLLVPKADCRTVFHKTHKGYLHLIPSDMIFSSFEILYYGVWT